jgi:hypothetical protein
MFALSFLHYIFFVFINHEKYRNDKIKIQNLFLNACQNEYAVFSLICF